MYRILLPVDDDEDRARAQAAFVAGLPAADSDISVVVTHTLTSAETDAPEELRNVERVDTVKLVRDALEERGIAVELAEARHPPAEGILDIVAEFEVDHVAMGSRQRSPAGKAIFGSVAQQVILEADVPVTVVGPTPD
ncbi:universal stress protein [Halobellus inordinatus]|uniref:universal stress protein n=1 Tax=Halobellus inordinatus TaxID=1126236 RepID=UPI0021086D37|nr:universal stress protein [Halobellus inordinatus]